ncbi:hypothetical protein ACLMJK_002054 [Lecanora helva]
MSFRQPETKQSIYFGYGSNLCQGQMQLRCPKSRFLGLGRLSDYRWMINDRGYANIVPNQGSQVYGLVYSLEPSDESALDRNEGVPFAYTKKSLEVDFWASHDNCNKPNLDKADQKRQTLVYIDRERTTDHRPQAEYIIRMNKGIVDGLRHGMPEDYVDQSLRKFIPAKGDESFKEQAERKAARFSEDED